MAQAQAQGAPVLQAREDESVAGMDALTGQQQGNEVTPGRSQSTNAGKLIVVLDSPHFAKASALVATKVILIPISLCCLPCSTYAIAGRVCGIGISAETSAEKARNVSHCRKDEIRGQAMIRADGAKRPTSTAGHGENKVIGERRHHLDSGEEEEQGDLGKELAADLQHHVRPGAGNNVVVSSAGTLCRPLF